tara:strand:+ start:568 stop:1323 length:756 start_codon:yes stop_codon:yes gene_type:complete
MEPLTMGLIAGGSQLLGAVGNFFGQQDQTDAQNETIAKQYRNQLKIRYHQDLMKIAGYNLSVDNYKQNLFNRDKIYQAEGLAESLRMNELLKGSRFADQTDAVNMTTAKGRVTAKGRTGKSAARMQGNAVAQIGRNKAIRAKQMFGEMQASELRNETRAVTETAKRDNMYNQVRFGPQFGPGPAVPTFADGPSSMSLLTGIGQAALGGYSAYAGQVNFREQLAATQPSQWGSLGNSSYNTSFKLPVSPFSV